jgi:hypothetical protein
MATSKVNTSRFLAKGGDRGQKVGAVTSGSVAGKGNSSSYLPTGKKEFTVGGRIAGLSNSAKARDA